jgi:outer membrane protein assembly factor BamB
VYIAVGQDPEHGEGTGHLWCIDPTRRGDVSAELAVRVEDRSQVVPVRRLQAVVPEEGEVAIDNPNSAVVWHYSQFDQNRDGKIDFGEEMRRSLSTPVIKDDLLYIADISGRFRCLNAKTGEVYWTYDLLSACWGSALVVDGKVFIGDEDGDIHVFRHSADPAVAMPDGGPLAKIDTGTSIYSTPIAANGVLYIANRSRLFAIAEDDPPVNGQGQGDNGPQSRGPQGNGLSQESEVPRPK